jgi:hypothetical protein
MQQKTHKTILLGQNYDALPITRCDTKEMLLGTLRKKTKPRHISIIDDACTISLTKKEISYIGTLSRRRFPISAAQAVAIPMKKL